LFIVVIIDPVEGERIVKTQIEADLILVDCYYESAVLAREYPLKLAASVKLIQHNGSLEEGREKFTLSGTKLKKTNPGH
jgi:hypothetical protein